MKNLRIGVRLSIAFGIVLLMLAALAILSLERQAEVNRQMTSLIHIDVAKSSLTNEMRLAVLQQAIHLRNTVMFTDSDVIHTQADEVQRQADRYRKARDELSRLATSTGKIDDQEQALLNQVGAAERAARPLLGQVLELALDNRKFPARMALTETAAPAQETWLQSIDRMVQWQEERTVQAEQGAAVAYGLTRLTIIGLTLTTLVLTAIIGLGVTRSITMPITQAVEVAGRVAASDLNLRFSAPTRDETGHLMIALKTMTESLSRVVAGVRAGANSVAVASDEIARGNDDLSARTETQAAQVQRTAVAMVSLAATVRDNAAQSERARTLADSAVRVANEGGSAIARVVRTMHDVEQSARKIESIVALIEGIAFQTDILALNAAAEAARAGSHGKGFGAVASEVRMLSQRSAGAARNVRRLIIDSVGQTITSVGVVDETAATIGRVVEAIDEVAKIVSSISAATVGQSSEIEGVNRALSDIRATTQGNAALVEQVATASLSLRNQAQSLAKEVSKFRLAESLPGADQAPSLST